jgi:predicted amidohydrolase YtcJ
VRTVRRSVGPSLFVLLVTVAQAQDADLVVYGRVWTGDSAAPWAAAVAVRGERILAVGGAAQVAAHVTPRTRVVQTGGRFIMPGFIDNHTHFAQAGALLLGVNLLDVNDDAALARRVREARDRLPAGAWMTGGDWGAYAAWAQGSTGRDSARGPGVAWRPHRRAIDSLTPAVPVLLVKWDRAEFLANGAALSAARIGCDVQGVECERGVPTGRLTPAAAARVRAAMPPKAFEQRLAEARAALADLLQHGVTTIHDNTGPEQFAVYQALRERGELTVRVYARPTLDRQAALRQVGIVRGFGDEWIRYGGLKGFVDGIMGNSSARFYEPYLTSGRRGDWRTQMSEPPGMLPLLLGADSAGYWPQVHAIGDEAIDTLLTMFEHVMRVNPAQPPRERRWRVIHTQVIRGPEVAARMARLGVIAEVQPYHAIDDMRWMEQRIGPRSRWAYAFRTLQRAGVRLSFGSDWPGTNASWYTSNPIHGIYAAVTRQTLDGRPAAGWFPEERVDVETALRAYTVNNAWAAGEEQLKGTLKPGLLADIVVLSDDPLATSPPHLRDIRPLLVVIGGRVLLERSRAVD